MANQGLDLGQINPLQYSATGAPVLDSSYRNTALAARPQGASSGELLGGAAQGAAIGSQIMPGIGTAIGAVGGAIINAIGGGARKRKQRRERQQALEKANAQQQEFNQADLYFDQQQAARQAYRDRQDMTNRIYNLYSV
jgi:hypothetical protein